MSTLAGSGLIAFADGTGAAASFSAPTDAAFDASGSAVIADTNNRRIRLVTPGALSRVEKEMVLFVSCNGDELL